MRRLPRPCCPAREPTAPRTRDGDRIEVLDQLPELPAGWGPDGPSIAALPLGSVRAAPRATIVDVAPTAPARSAVPGRRRRPVDRQPPAVLPAPVADEHRHRRSPTQAPNGGPACRLRDEPPGTARRARADPGRRGGGRRRRWPGSCWCCGSLPGHHHRRSRPSRPRTTATSPSPPGPPTRPDTTGTSTGGPHPATPASPNRHRHRDAGEPQRRGSSAPGSRRVTGAPVSTGPHWSARWPTAAISGGRLADRRRRWSEPAAPERRPATCPDERQRGNGAGRQHRPPAPRPSRDGGAGDRGRLPGGRSPVGRVGTAGRDVDAGWRTLPPRRVAELGVRLGRPVDRFRAGDLVDRPGLESPLTTTVIRYVVDDGSSSFRSALTRR